MMLVRKTPNEIITSFVEKRRQLKSTDLISLPGMDVVGKRWPMAWHSFRQFRYAIRCWVRFILVSRECALHIRSKSIGQCVLCSTVWRTGHVVVTRRPTPLAHRDTHRRLDSLFLSLFAAVYLLNRSLTFFVDSVHEMLHIHTYIYHIIRI